jgi:hypothetical protein
MYLLSAKCPNCSAILNVPLHQEMFKCEYCGGTIITSDLDEYKNMPNGKKYLNLANTYYDINNFKKALFYYDKSLECEPNNPFAWYGKSRVSYKLLNRFDTKPLEIINYCKKAVEYSFLYDKNIIIEEISKFLNDALISHHVQNIYVNLNGKSLSVFYNAQLIKEIINFLQSIDNTNIIFIKNSVLICKENIKFGNNEKYWYDKLKELDDVEYNNFIMELETEKKRKKLLQDIDERKSKELLKQQIENGNRKATMSYFVNFGVFGGVFGFLLALILKCSNKIDNLFLIFIPLVLFTLSSLLGIFVSKIKNQKTRE